MIFLIVSIKNSTFYEKQDIVGQGDPYVRVIFNDKKFKTKTFKNTLTATFNEDFRFPFDKIKNKNELLLFELWDKDFLFDDLVGSCAVGELERFENKKTPMYLIVKNEKGKDTGELNVEIELDSKEKEEEVEKEKNEIMREIERKLEIARKRKDIKTEENEIKNVKTQDDVTILFLKLVGTDTDTKEKCIAVLEEKTLSFMLWVLNFQKEEEKEKKKEKEKENLVGMILDVLVRVGMNLFRAFVSSKEEGGIFQTRMKKVDGYNKLLNLLKYYRNIHERQQISIILGLFYSWCEIPKESEIIIEELVKGLKSPITLTTNKAHLDHIIYGLIGISREDENKKKLIRKGVIFLIFPLISFDNSEICKDSIILLSSIIINNSEVVDALLDSPLIPSFLQTLESTSSSLISSSSNADVVEIQKSICLCFVYCTYFSYEQSARLVDFGVIPSLLCLLEKHVNMMKRKEGKKMDEGVIRQASTALYNITSKGFNEFSSREKNKFYNSFNSVDGVRRLYEVFDYLHTQQNQYPLEKEGVDFISLCICFLLKSFTPPKSYLNLLLYVKEMKSSPSPSSEFDFPLSARISWNGMLDADKCLLNYQK